MKITKQESFKISAKGSHGPNMKVRINGEEIYSTVVNNTEYQTFTINHEISSGILDIVFDNDFYDKSTGEDRNLYVDYVQIGSRKITSRQMVFDRGTDESAFDCENTENVSQKLIVNGALRLKLET